MPNIAYLVDSSALTFGQPFFDSNWQGPIVYGGSVYVVAELDENSTGDSFLAVFKSDQAFPGTVSSFTPQDRANSPKVNAGKGNVFYPKTGGNLLYISATSSTVVGGALRIYTFNMNTDTFTLVSNAGPIPQQGANRLVHRSNGDWVIAYDFFIAGIRQIYWTKYNGAWSAGVLVSTEIIAGETGQVVQVGVNATDDVIIYRQRTNGGTFTDTYSVLSVAGALTAVRTFRSGVTTDLNQGVSGGPYFLAATDQWLFPFTDLDAGFACVMKSGPSANPSADSIEQVSVVSLLSDFPGTRVTADPTEAKLYCAWNVVDVNHQMLSATQTVPGITWSAPVVIFDTAVDSLSPPTGITPSLVERPTLTVLADAELFTFGTFAPVPSITCDIQYFGQFSLVNAPTLACPVTNTGTLGVPFTATLQASGGTAPYAFAIIAGSLPPGLTLDASTGVISGTPTTAGVYPYTAQVTDANDLTATADCSITIGSPEPPPPPELCIIIPTPASSPTLIAYQEPPELQGS